MVNLYLTISINGRQGLTSHFHKRLQSLSTISINGCQMLRGNNLISQPSLTTAKASYQNLAISNRGPGGSGGDNESKEVAPSAL